MYKLEITADSATELRENLLKYLLDIDGTSADTAPSAPRAVPAAIPTAPQPETVTPSYAAPTPAIPAPATAIPAPATAIPVPATAIPVPTPISPVPAPTAVPTAVPTYTQADLMTAGARLMTTVGMPAMQELMARFGVQAIHQLKPEQYGAFAQALRDMGAQI